MTGPSDPARPIQSPESPCSVLSTAQRVPRVPTKASDWQAKRSVITKLYLEDGLPLKDVQRILEAEHGFKASKRMYMTRIKQWDLCKNLRAKDKEALVVEIAKARHEKRPLQQITFKDRPVKIDRVLRHCKALLRKRKRAAAARLYDEGNAPRRAIDDEQARLQQSQTPETSDKCLAAPLNISVPKTSPMDPKQMPLPTPRILRKGHDGTDIELLLYSTSTFYSSLSGLRLLSSEQSSVSMNFWTSIKSAIYFLKKDTPRLAWPLLNKACQTPINALLSTPVLLLRELYSVLSPVNAKMHGQVRLALLGYLRQLACLALGLQHPITTILAQLQLDSGTRHASESGLRYLLSQYEPSSSTSTGISELDKPTRDPSSNSHPINPNPSQPGKDPSAQQQPTPFQTHYISTLRALVNLHRRDYSLPSALTLSHQLTTYTTIHLSPSHPLTLTALTEHVHILSDMCDYQPALKIAHQIINTYQSVQWGPSSPSFPDSKACYAMEVIAELNHIIGDSGEEEKWLRYGLQSAWKVRGGDASVMFVRSKFEKLLEGQGRMQEAENVRLRFPEEDVEAVQ